MTDPDARADTLADAIIRAGAESVEYADDDQHVYVQRTGAADVERFRLTREARRFLAGEVPRLPVGARHALNPPLSR